jgi:hypothetical protein
MEYNDLLIHRREQDTAYRGPAGLPESARLKICASSRVECHGDTELVQIVGLHAAFADSVEGLVVLSARRSTRLSVVMHNTVTPVDHSHDIRLP